MTTSDNELRMLLAGKRAFLVDLDGVVYTGASPISGAREFFDHIHSSHASTMLITNNSTRTASDVAHHLQQIGIAVEAREVLTSPEATVTEVRRRCGDGARVYAIGENGLIRSLLTAGFRLTADPNSADAVVCGLDRQLTYDRLRRACVALSRGVAFIAANPDRSLPTEAGLLPGNGATIAYLQAATGVTPIIVGKPARTMIDLALSRLGVASRDAVMIGDGLETDILAGHNAGVDTILVMSGVTTPESLAVSAIKPSAVAPSIATIWQLLASA